VNNVHFNNCSYITGFARCVSMKRTKCLMFILGKFTSIHIIRQQSSELSSEQSSEQSSERFSEQSEIVCANRTNTKVNCCF